MEYIVNVSGGLTSYEALRRTVEKHGAEHVHAIFADTTIEDIDLYRFLDDVEALLKIQIVRLRDGRDPWQVMIDRRAITMNGAAPCSKELKRKVIDRYIADHFEVGTYVRVFGMDWTEIERMDNLRKELAPTDVWFPLCDKPFVDKCHIANYLERAGVKAPNLYTLGFTHNNCGGGCVKAGMAHWAHLWRTLPERYLLWEAKEAEIREYLGKDVAIIKERNGGGPRRPLTLKDFRLRLENGYTAYDKDEWGGCGCFAPVPQMRFDSILLSA